MDTNKFDIEGRIFSAAIVISMASAFLFLILDLFLFEDFYSVLIEFGSILILSAFFVMSLNSKVKHRLIVPFIVFMFTALDFGWYFGGGLNISMALLMFLALIASLLMVGKPTRVWVAAGVGANFTVLAILEHTFHSIREINTDITEVLISSHVVIGLTFAICAVMITIFVNSFDKANAVIVDQNHMLEAKAGEVHEINLRLQKQHQEILQQQRVIEQKNRELLQQTEDKFYKIFQTTPNAISISQLSDGVILDVNDALIKLSGYSREELIGKSSLDVGLWSDASEREFLSTELRKNGEVLYREFRFLTKAGKERVAVYSARLITLADNPCIMLIADDITDRKRTESELNESFRKLESFAKKNSHDVRAPLSRLMGLVQLLKESKGKKEQVYLLDQLLNAANELDEIIHEINDVLDNQKLN